MSSRITNKNGLNFAETILKRRMYIKITSTRKKNVFLKIKTGTT